MVDQLAVDTFPPVLVEDDVAGRGGEERRGRIMWDGVRRKGAAHAGGARACRIVRRGAVGRGGKWREQGREEWWDGKVGG